MNENIKLFIYLFIGKIRHAGLKQRRISTSGKFSIFLFYLQLIVRDYFT